MAEPIIVAVIAMSSWIRLSREWVRDSTDALADEGFGFVIVLKATAQGHGNSS